MLVRSHSRELLWGRRLAALLLVLVGLSGVAAAQDRDSGVLVTRVDGAITPVIATHVADGIARAEREGLDAFLIRLDTPGGLDVSMRRIVQDILASEVPVIVYVSPQGARGASAGAIVTFAAHIAAMAPGTSIGAATPVSGESGEDLDAKIVNDAVAYATSIAELRDRNADFIAETVRNGRAASASEALELGAIDVVAASTPELLALIDGRSVSVGARGQEAVLRTAGARLDNHDLGVLRSIQRRLADPNLAFLLLSLGTLGLIYELASPGLGVGGVLGTTFILVAMFGLAVLPVDLVGLLFLLLAAALFVAEVLAPGVGLAAAGGALCLVLSGIFLFDDTPGLDVSIAVVLPTALVVGSFVVLGGRFALRARSKPSTATGPGSLVGCQVPLRGSGSEPQVFVQGAWWSVRPRDPDSIMEEGDMVEIVDLDGLHLIVVPSPSTGQKPGGDT